MKRLAVIFTAILLMVFSTAVPAGAADSFKIKDTNPTDGYSKVHATNVMVKIFFNMPVEKSVSAEDFTFTDSKGKKVDYQVITDPDNDANVNLLVKKDLKEKSKYKVTVSGNLESASGEKLGKSQTIEFQTSSTSGGFAYAILMMVMVAVMIAMTIRDQRKQAKAEAENNIEMRFETNPYKLAKEKNISVAQANEIINAEREKLRKKIEKKNAKAVVVIEKKKEPEKTVYRVKSKRVKQIRK